MTLTELLDALTQRSAIPPARVKDLKTSLRYLARAEDTTPDNLINAETLEPRYQTVVRAYFAAMNPNPSRYTIRNTLNNLSFFFRTARACGLLQTFIPQPARQKINNALREEASQTSPYMKYFRVTNYKYRLPPTAWPPNILAGWTRYLSARQFELRATSLRAYELQFTRYISYLLTFEQPAVTTWDQLFDPERLKHYIQWHAKRMGISRITTTGTKAVALMIMIARHDERPEYPLLKAFARKLPTPEPIHDKQRAEHSITLQELENVGLTLLQEAHRPIDSRRQWGGSRLAVRHAKALMIRLLTRVPLRQRNIRELQLGRNLCRDHQGVWQLQFQGEELKIGQRGGRINTFRIPFPPDLIEHLDEYLQHYRPLLPRSVEDQHLFLNAKGRPYTTQKLHNTLFIHIYARTGKRFYPHLIRTIWTDTYLLQTGDISTAAFMLNDRPETVLNRYHELRANDHVSKAHIFTQHLFGAQIPD
jgi:hypothetical protein